MGKRFVSKKKSKLNILKLIIWIGVIYILLNFLVSKLTQNTENSLLAKILSNTALNKFTLNKVKGIDLSNPEIILDTALNFNDIVKIPKKQEDKSTFQENKIYQVYIYNTHQTEEYDAGSLANYNIDLTVYTAANILKSKLDSYSIDTYVEDRSIQEYLNKYGFNYNQSYKISREFLETFGKEVNLYVDLHRDSAGKDVTTTTIDSKNYARVMFVVGTNYDTYNLNMEVANKLNNYFREFDPSITRGIFTRVSVYNQDLNPNIILLELGGPYNTLEEIENTLEVFASVINKYFGG